MTDQEAEGDIWALQNMEDFLSPLWKKTLVTQVSKGTGTLQVKGFSDQHLKAWLLEKDIWGPAEQPV